MPGIMIPSCQLRIKSVSENYNCHLQKPILAIKVLQIKTILIFLCNIWKYLKEYEHKYLEVSLSI